MAIAWAVMGAAIAWLAAGYAGYPLLLWILSRVAPRRVRRADTTPAISIIIAVHNGASSLSGKLEATLALAYPGTREVIVASDGSTDETDAIAARFAERGVELVRIPERRGKEAAQAAAIQRSHGEVLVFTDVGVALEPDSLTQLLRAFADPSVGCVSSEDLVEGGGGEGAYVRYEMALRRLESMATTLIGLSGSLFAARRELCTPWPDDLASDFRTALEAARRGMRAVSEPGARVRIRALESAGREWGRKVRTVRRGLAVLSAYRDLLSPRAGRVALSVWGHKVMRFTSPFALLALLGGSAAAAPSDALACALLLTQLALYAAGVAALLHAPLTRLRLARLSAFFVLVNASMLVAWMYHLSGRRAVTWTPTDR